MKINPLEEITPEKLVSEDGLTDLSVFAEELEEIRSSAIRKMFDELFKEKTND